MKESVAIVVRSVDGRYLGVPRRNGKGMVLAGGKVEEGESRVQAALRELREETGIVASVENVGYLFNINDESQYLCSYFVLKPLMPEVEYHGDTGVCSWLTKKDIVESTLWPRGTAKAIDIVEKDPQKYE